MCVIEIHFFLGRIVSTHSRCRRLSDAYETICRLSDAYETICRLSDAYETSRRLSEAYGHIYKKKKLSLWFLVSLKKEIHALSDFSIGFWIEM